MFRRQAPIPQPQERTRTPEWLNAWTGLSMAIIAIITLITSQQVNFTKLQADNEIMKQDMREIKENIYPRNEAEAALNALQNQFQSGDRLLEEKIKHIEKP